MKVNTHGYKMVGLREVCSMTKDLEYYGPMKVQVVYWPKQGLVRGRTDVLNNTVVYDGDYVTFDVRCRCTMQELADKVRDAMYKRDVIRAWGRE